MQGHYTMMDGVEKVKEAVDHLDKIDMNGNENARELEAVGSLLVEALWVLETVSETKVKELAGAYYESG